MSSKSKKTANLKQGNLFSFFAKKPSAAATATKKKSSGTTTAKKSSNSNSNINSTPKKSLSQTSDRSSSPSSSTASSSRSQVSPSPASKTASTTKKDKSKKTNLKWKELSVGSKISVFWPDDETFYPATIVKQEKASSRFWLEYDDGESEWIDLATEQFKLLPLIQKKSDNAPKSTSTDNDNDNSNKKRRRIDESDDEEEHEWEEDEAASSDDDDGSVYDPKSAPKEIEEDDDDDDAGQWMVTDDEDDHDIIRRPSKKSKPSQQTKKSRGNKSSSKSSSSSFKVISHRPSSATSISTPPTHTGSTSSPLQQFANTVSPSSVSTDSIKKKATNSPTGKSSPATSSVPRSIAKEAATPAKALPYVKGTVNPRGSHVHNHLNFLRNPRDKNGRKPTDPDYDPRTLQVRERDWESHVGKMTNAVKQWWELKSQYFDTVLLFKTGKFYEMFHMDADIGVDVLGLIYMKGHIAHAGYPEISYGSMADKLVRAGYKVARVEQTETPDQLKIRKQRTTKGKKPQVVNREVCSIMTLGTRTFCALDDTQALMNDQGNGGIGPMLVIREVLLNQEDSMDTSNDDGEEGDEVQPVCEYGITLIDSVRATVTLGQFADDILRSRMNTLLTSFSPSEILLEGGENGASPILRSLIKAYQTNSPTMCRVENIQSSEMFPKSQALNPEHRRLMERKTTHVHPWDIEETVDELHRRGYFPRGSRVSSEKRSISRWPKVLQAVIEGNADLCLASFGASLFYLQRNLIDHEILSMGIVKAYVPPASSCISNTNNDSTMETVIESQQQEEEMSSTAGLEANPFQNVPQIANAEDHIKNMALDGTTLHNLEILTNSVDHKVTGSLWSKINFTKTPHGARMLRAWLLRPLFRKADIDRRCDAVQELVAGAGAVALNEARDHVLRRIGDLDRLLSRVHTMSGTTSSESESGYHPNERAVLYEGATYTKRKVGDFSKLLTGLRTACQLPELFQDLQLEGDSLLYKVVRLQNDGGCFPDMTEELDWFFDNFDCEKAAKGHFEPSRGVDEAYDEACDTLERIRADLESYKQEMCDELSPRHTAKSSWKYINVKPASKDKYLIELPASVRVPDDFIVKGKRGSGMKQVNKYRTSYVAGLVQELEQALEVQAVRKAKGMQLIFNKFDQKRSLWAAAAQATGILDALGSLAKTAGKSGYCRPTILECPLDQEPTINVVQGRHPCVENSVHSTEFIPNDLALGRASQEDSSRLLLLSGPNMGGKSTLLRQTCLIAILAQIGSFVPAESCELTPIDCIYTRLGASDRILLGQSTFFVELAETAAALRGATRRSLVIMDELGRGTSTFDGTAIAGATVKHLVDRSQCLSLFATHYHSLLDEWKDEPKVRLGHMQCIVEDNEDDDSDATSKDKDNTITFLYTLGTGTCPKSFGINVARLASLPAEVLSNAKKVSEEFEEQMAVSNQQRSIESAKRYKEQIQKALESDSMDELQRIWKTLRG